MNRFALPTLALGALLTASGMSTTHAAAGTAPMVSGKVTARDGSPAPGATVALFAEPQASTKLKTGAKTPLPLIATAKTDSKGRYSFRLPARFDTTAYTDAAGIMSFTAVARAGSYTQTMDFQRQVDTSAGTARLVAVDSADSFTVATAKRAAAQSAVTAEPAGVSFNLRSSKAQKVRRTAASKSAAAANAPVAAASVSKVKDYGSRWVYVGQWQSTTSGVKAKFHYQESASSSLGYAVSSSGKAGSFKFGGTKSKSSDASVGFPRRDGKGSVKFRTTYNYQKRFYQTCTAGWTCSSHYKIEPIAWRGGASTLKKSVPSANKCVPMEKGSDHTQNSTKAYTFESGVSNSGMTVVELSARSGFTKTVKQNVTFTKKGQLCGRNAYPGGAPKILAAKGPKKK